MQVLELFAGSRSIGKVADRLSFAVYSTDIEQFGGIDYVTDILEFDVTKIPFVAVSPYISWLHPSITILTIGYSLPL